MPQEVQAGSLQAPPPESLLSLASSIREGTSPGVAFVGTIIPPIETAEPDRVDLGDFFVSYGRNRASVSLVDALGETLSMTLELLASDGATPTLTDADGEPTSDWILSGNYPAMEQKQLAEGTFLLFAARPPDTDHMFLVWRAEIQEDVAAGDGTVSGTDYPLDSLRR
jgi:hypothetical protein